MGTEQFLRIFSSLNRIHCPLLCDEENPQINTQKHLLTCKKIKITNANDLTMMSLSGSLSDQDNIGRVVARILRKYRKTSGKDLR